MSKQEMEVCSTDIEELGNSAPKKKFTKIFNNEIEFRGDITDESISELIETSETWFKDNYYQYGKYPSLYRLHFQSDGGSVPAGNRFIDYLSWRVKKICKNTKSNTIVFAKNNTLIASGTGQTSRVDALKQAIEKANTFGFDLHGAVMASDAFFPFPDCVEIANHAGITAVIQPGGSIKDELSINYCNENKVAMVFTGTRHFKH